jgi:hypothetical protein
MRFTRFFILLLICYFAGSNAVIAQGDKKITINVTDVSLLKFVEEIERSTNYRFYFDPVETDSLLITVKADNATLDQVMQTALQQSVFQYAVDQLNRVYITKKYKIQTEIPADFFDGKKAAKDTASEPVILLPGADEKDKLRASLEKKLFEIGQRTSSISKGNARITGYVRDVKSGEAISGASVYVDTPSIKTITDQFGYFAITLPKGRHTLRVNSLGMKDTKRQLVLYSDGKLTVELEDYVASLKAVTVTTDRRSNVRSTQMGVDKVNIRTIKQVPSVLGESDILRVVLTLPGVTSVGEASTGFNVRGGAADQNLILLNDATIYNPSHLFGFFSAFNTDVVKGVELYKSAIPEKYGGRLSSVLDVSTRDGNSKKLSGTGGSEYLPAGLHWKGHLIKRKDHFYFGRKNNLFRLGIETDPQFCLCNSSCFFLRSEPESYHAINPKNSIYLTGYYQPR